ncbi:MAG: HDOD domain-containing protein, partial [Armatimonadetes bacterium]|nr:HDOD domain-containing protein [Armatimonadota bacterium]
MLLKQTLTQAGCEVVTANSADDALKLVRQSHFGLVVVDLVGTPGASDQLVLEIRVLGSTVPLLLMLQSADRDLLRRLSNLKPIGFLTKPVVVDSLTTLLPRALAGDKELLTRSAEMARMGRGAARDAEAFVVAQGNTAIDDQRLQHMFGDLPMLPSVLTRLLELSNRDDATAQDMAEVISSDPRLSSQLLRVVNSAFFGFSRRIATIPEATVILGTQALRSLASGAAVSQFFGGSSTVLDRTQLWRHSLGVGVASRLLAQQVASAKAEEAFTAGLLHDFGRVCLDRYMGEQY